MATVRKPSSLAARRMRIAISPRFSARSFFMRFETCGERRSSEDSRSYEDSAKAAVAQKIHCVPIDNGAHSAQAIYGVERGVYEIRLESGACRGHAGAGCDSGLRATCDLS